MRKAAAPLLGLLLACLMGCSTEALLLSSAERVVRNRYHNSEYPANYVPGLRRVGLIVLDASPKYHPDLDVFSAALYGELQQVSGLEVVPNAMVLRTLAGLEPEGIELPRDGLKLADALSLDGLFVAIVTDYNPYGDPSVAVGLTLFSRAVPAIRPAQLDWVRQGGRPLAMPTTPGTKPVTAVFAVYDSSQKILRQRLRWYAEGRTASKEGLGWERYYRSMPMYMRFVSYEMVWELFEQILVDRSTVRGTPG